MKLLHLTVTFLDGRFHGLLDRAGPPEWPPSPFRLFCALVAGVARRGELGGALGGALRWLQSLPPPIIIAPKVRTGNRLTWFVPNNDGDEIPDRQERLTGKLNNPKVMLLKPSEKPQIHYLWDVPDEATTPWDHIRDAARRLTTLGWGIDMAFADTRALAKCDLSSFQGSPWRPRADIRHQEPMLRVPTALAETGESTLDNLIRCHQSLSSRIGPGEPLRTVEKPSAFRHVHYEPPDGPSARPHAIFDLCDENGELFAYPQRRFIHIAGMVRHASVELAKKARPRGAPDDWAERYVAGHRSKDHAVKHRQLSYVPLPSIGHVHTDPSIRRVMIAGMSGEEEWIEFLSRRLAGTRLVPTPETRITDPPTLEPARRSKVVANYLDSAKTWATVTPVILPGHDDHKPEKTKRLIEMALRQSGVQVPCEFEWRAIPWFRQSHSAHKKRPAGYFRPSHLLDFTAVHLKITFLNGARFPGPLVVGAGRHCGFGLFAPLDG